MFKKVLIANRGAIAVRIIRTLSRLGVTSVAVFNEADADSLHVLHADENYSLGEGRAADTYLNQQRLLDIAKQCGVDAIHPGYGFLSENPGFVTRCNDAGIVFIGPTPQQMQSFGLKHSARALAQANNVPLMPGTDLLGSVQQACDAANQIGYPVMLKSTAGGGGIGMQLCHNEAELLSCFDSVQRLSENNFSNSGVFLEKFIQQARHIEVQIFGDGKGDAIALGERDCSSQRRNQKVIEETPAPNLSESVRAQMHQTAIDLAKAVHYQNAGTVEYVYDQKTEQFYFLEVNTRLQVEHGVTEQVFDVDLVEMMLLQASGDMTSLPGDLRSQGHAIQTRVYAEDPHKAFQPSAGLLSHVVMPEIEGCRIDHWISSGLEISPLFDPMLAKVIVTAVDREQAIAKLDQALASIELYGVETNIHYVRQILHTVVFQQGNIVTRYLNAFQYQPPVIDVLSGGTMTTIQDYPGRLGYWDVGVPASGPFDTVSFRLANRLLDNDSSAAGLEMTLNGPTLIFNCDTRIVLTGAVMECHLDEQAIDFWSVVNIKAGQILKIGRVQDAGARAYLAVKGGIECPSYLNSKSTFTLGRFGGHAGRQLQVGDVLHVSEDVSNDIGEKIGKNIGKNIGEKKATKKMILDNTIVPAMTHNWQLHVVYGPQGAPDFFTDEDIVAFFAAHWEVHYNSSRTGIRLVGPKPQWARSDGGEAGMHPSNIHDNAYAIGAVDYTGDMPVILGPDGPSLGGFVCPATVVSADLWKLGQLKAGDKLQFIPVSIETATQMEQAQLKEIELLKNCPFEPAILPVTSVSTPIIKIIDAQHAGMKVVYRPCGDKYLLIEYGLLTLDIELRFRVHALLLWLQQKNITGIIDLTPGIRSLQVHYDNHVLSLATLLTLLESAEQQLEKTGPTTVPARIVHLPLSWDDSACQLAIDKYMQSVRKDAPWCPSNIEFIRRINGLDSIAEVKKIIFDASYLVMGLGDVYLGAPVATPIDPRHRLVTTKYNPARTWTAENSVGIGGSYLCVYGMEGPGGYQFVGRTLQMWNRYHKTDAFEQPWLLRFFDQIRFFEVSADELTQIRQDFPRGRYHIDIEQTQFSLDDYRESLTNNAASIGAFKYKREQAFEKELQRWIESGQINFQAEQDMTETATERHSLPDNCVVIESTVAGSVWALLVKLGERVEAGQPLVILESMKMEITLTSAHSGTVYAINRREGSQVNAGQAILIVEED